MSTPLATLFTKIGFDIDTKSIAALDASLARLESRLKGLSSSLQGISNNKTLAAAARLANAEARRINAEVGLQRQNAALAKVQAATEKLKQATLKEDLKLQQKKESTANHYARANASIMLGKFRAGNNVDMAALKESVMSGATTLRLKELAAKTEAKTAATTLRLKELAAKTDAKAAELGAKTAAFKERTAHSVGLQEAQAAKLNASTANKLAAAQLRATPYAQRPTRPANDKSFNGIGGIGLNYQTAVGAIAGGGFISQAYDVANFSTSRMPQYEFLTGSAEEARKQIAFVDKEVDRLSLDMMAANTQYKQMLAAGATSIGLEKTQELFTNTSNLATMLGLTTDAQKRMTNAFSQMMSKGQVYSEELDFRLAA